MVSFYTLWMHQKTADFRMFSAGIERDRWHETGQTMKKKLTVVQHGHKG